MLDEYQHHEAERAALGIPPRPLTGDQARQVTAALVDPALDEDTRTRLRSLLEGRVSPGVGEAAEVKAAFLREVAGRRVACPALTAPDAVRLLGTMQGGYSVAPLLDLLDDPELGPMATDELAATALVPAGAFDQIAARAAHGGERAQEVLRRWAASDWLSRRPPLGAELHLTVFKVDGETNTDDLSPATEAWSRADIPLHALSLLENRLGRGQAPARIAELAGRGRPVAFVGDVVGTGSSRKSAVNSLLWHIGHDIPGVPDRRTGGVVIAGRMAPIFFDTLVDSGGLPVECDPAAVAGLATGDHIVLRTAAGRLDTPDGTLISPLRLREDLPESVRAGGRIRLILGRRLARRSGSALPDGQPADRARSGPPPRRTTSERFTLAQKMVGRACGEEGVRPGTYCEPETSTVGSQDTTGPMNRSELEDLACLTFGADLVLQTFCHTAAYPKPADIEAQTSLPGFMGSRGAVVLRPGDGIIHSWLNRMLLPDGVGTGSDSHTRFPLGISFPAGSGLVAFAAAFGAMPLTMPESVLVRFAGTRRPGITLRDLVNAIPFEAARQGLLSSGPGPRWNAFSGRIIEMEGLEDLSVEEAFELTDSTAERSAAACTINLAEERVAAHLRVSVRTLRDLLDAGYQGGPALERRIGEMEAWLADPTLLRADRGAGYAAVLEIDVDTITEPLLACPNDPDDVRPLSETAGRPVDEVFVGSCMTHVGYFRAAGRILATADAVPADLWIAPPTREVQDELRGEGLYSVFGRARGRTETPGCSLCMGNQARVRPGATVVSTSTRNFPGRMGRDADVYLASAEVAALAAVHGRIPTVEEYMAAVT